MKTKSLQYMSEHDKTCPGEISFLLASNKFNFNNDKIENIVVPNSDVLWSNLVKTQN